jgi:hypothetical protein
MKIEVTLAEVSTATRLPVEFCKEVIRRLFNLSYLTDVTDTLEFEPVHHEAAIYNVAGKLSIQFSVDRSSNVTNKATLLAYIEKGSFAVIDRQAFP